MRRWLLVALLVVSCKQASRKDEARPLAGEVRERNAVAARPAAPAGRELGARTDPARRGLTAAEKALLRPLFQSSVDYDAVRVVDGKYMAFQPADTYMTPDGNIYAPGDLFEDDFADESVSPGRRGVFVHEIVHVWQHASGMSLVKNGIASFFSSGGAYGSVYTYRLDRGLDLLDYGFEAQASIVQDYFSLEAGFAPTHLDDSGATAGEARAMYRQVLAKFLADPGYAKRLSPDELEAKQEQARVRKRAAVDAARAAGELETGHGSCGCTWH